MSGYVRTSYTERPFSHSLAQNLARLMEEKKSNICLAADVKTMDQLLKIADIVGEQIVVLKTHVDTYSDFTPDKIQQLTRLAEKHKFCLFEDRKFLDIGNTVAMQYTGGIYKIADWSSLTNATIASGPDVLKALKEGIASVDKVGKNAILLLAEMSSEGNVFQGFLPQTIRAAKAYSDIVIGYIAQRSFGDPTLLYMTPGVNAIDKGDQLGQTYRTPEDVIRTGSDVLIIGR